MLQSVIKRTAVGLLILGLAACNSSTNTADKAPYKGVKIGKPYNISGQWYTPKYQPSYEQVGMASWYGPGFHGKQTASGERFDSSSLTAAHPTLPMPSLLEVPNLANGRKVIVRVNDRGPFSKKRIIDLSKAAALKLDMIRTGTAKVRVRYLKQETERYIASKGGNPKAIEIASGSTNEDWENDNFDAPIVSGPSVSAAPIYSVSSTPVGESASEPNNTSSIGDIFIKSAHADDDVSDYPSLSSYSTPKPRDGWEVAKAEMPTQLPASAPIAMAGSKEAPLKGDIYIQVGAFGIEANAQRTANQLASVGSASVYPVNANGKSLHRVRLGPYASVADANAALEQVHNQGFMDAKVKNY